MKSWLALTVLLVASSAYQAAAQSCVFSNDRYFGYTCELNDAIVTERNADFRVNTDNHEEGASDSSVTYFTLNPNTTSLSFFPNSIFAQFPSIRYLLIDYSGLTELTPFVGCGSVRIMHLRHSFIPSIPAGMFDACRSLRILDLSDNIISEIHDDAFASLDQLLELFIDNNKLTRISSQLFRNLGKVQDMYIRHNEISEIEDGAFSGLKELIIFYLRNNKITGIRPEIFGDEISLVFFNLNENELQTVPQLPSNAPSLKYIYVAGNNISEIKEGDFTFAYSNITNIDLSENHLRSLPAAPFEVLESLDILKVNDNEITGIDYELFDRIPSLYTFYCLNNKCANVRFDNIRSIDQDDEIAAAFDRCYYAFFTPETEVTCNYVQTETSYACRMTGVYFQNFRNRFEITGDHIEGLTNEDVTELHIDASNLLRVPPTPFESFPNLERVTIINSELSVIDEGTFEQCGRITFLDLSRNRIRRLSSRSFENCDNVDELYLDHNQITEIAPCNFFLENIKKASKLSLLNNICIDQFWDSSPDDLVDQYRLSIYPYLNRCFSLWYSFLPGF